MNERQIALARHALGLDGNHNQSYRNCFVAGPEHADYSDWQAMALDGNAIRRDGSKLPYGGNDLFHLTRAGAKKVLRGTERLDPEDF